jgi:hypothetical protein
MFVPVGEVVERISYSCRIDILIFSQPNLLLRRIGYQLPSVLSSQHLRPEQSRSCAAALVINARFTTEYYCRKSLNESSSNTRGAFQSRQFGPRPSRSTISKCISGILVPTTTSSADTSGDLATIHHKSLQCSDGRPQPVLCFRKHE